ncbi:MAG: hypothetical protein ACXWRA_11350 [Pseudobdellovibrionaceae bacterium]
MYSVVLIAYLVNGAIEAWLGKTSAIKSGSVLELLFNGLRGMIPWRNTFGVNMLDGKEVEGKIGADGDYSVDITDKGQVIFQLGYVKDLGGFKVSTSDSVEMDLVDLLRKLEPKVNNSLFTSAIESIAKALGK